MWLGLEANYCTELTLLEINKKVSYVLMFAAMMLFLTAAFGWTAAATKNDCLSYCVSAAFSQLTRLIIVWIPCHVHHACIHLAWGLHFHRQVEPCLANE